MQMRLNFIAAFFRKTPSNVRGGPITDADADGLGLVDITATAAGGRHRHGALGRPRESSGMERSRDFRDGAK
eukprot:scaffold12533_cov71-Skeletonema_dohrnii-CCMP3373.AAC.1